METVRLLLDPPAAGPWNMAVDEALLESAATGQTTLRFYEWAEPTLSLGYFQAAAERELHPASRDCPLVRRASGGGAIVHDRDLTYSLATPAGGRFAAPELYDLLHRSLIEVLGDLGVKAELCATAEATSPGNSHPPLPFLCFQRRTAGDVLCGSAKIAGSAQRRQRGALLQHGSVLLSRSPQAPELAGIAEASGIALSPAELTHRWSRYLQKRAGWELAPGALSPAEKEAAERFVAARFASPQWNYRK